MIFKLKKKPTVSYKWCACVGQMVRLLLLAEIQNGVFTFST